MGRLNVQRLLIVATVPVFIRSFLLPVARHFRHRGWRVDAMANDISGCAECVATFNEVWDVKWSRSPFRHLNVVTTLKRVQKILADNRYDLVHVHTPVAGFLTRLAVSRIDYGLRPRLIYTAHGFHFIHSGPVITNKLFLALEKLGGKWTDLLVVINTEDQEAAQRFKMVPSERLFFVPGVGIDRGHYSTNQVSHFDVERVRMELGLSSTDSLFLMVAELTPTKRHRDALYALRRLSRPDVHLAFAGNGPLTVALKQLATQLGLADRAHFLGYRHDVRCLILSSVATLLPSEREGLPRSVMESLCLGIPVIGTDIRGVRDLLGRGGGIMVKVGDIHGLTEAMNWVLDHPGGASAMGLRGRDEMSRYDLERVLALHEELYERAMRLTAAGEVR